MTHNVIIDYTIKSGHLTNNPVTSTVNSVRNLSKLINQQTTDSFQLESKIPSCFQAHFHHHLASRFQIGSSCCRPFVLGASW